MKKLLPVLLLVIMAILTFAIKRCNSNTEGVSTKQKTETRIKNPGRNTTANKTTAPPTTNGLDRSPEKLFFTKHAKCRMKCRHITQQEVKEILVKGEINYNKSELQAERGPKYAVEGLTSDKQRVRIIFAPNTKHISVVTVIDLEEEYACSCN